MHIERSCHLVTINIVTVMYIKSTALRSSVVCHSGPGGDFGTLFITHPYFDRLSHLLIQDIILIVLSKVCIAVFKLVLCLILVLGVIIVRVFATQSGGLKISTLHLNSESLGMLLFAWR